jgi:hypothetical protein
MEQADQAGPTRKRHLQARREFIQFHAVVRHELPELRHIRRRQLRDLRHHAFDVHQGAQAATGDLLLILDADTRFEPDRLARIFSMIRTQFVVQPSGCRAAQDRLKPGLRTELGSSLCGAEGTKVVRVALAEEMHTGHAVDVTHEGQEQADIAHCAKALEQRADE